MGEVVMQTVEPVSTREVTDRMVKIINSTYEKEYLKKVADNTTYLNDEERTQLLSTLEDFEYLFDGTLGEWATDPFKLELKIGSKMFNSRYYPVPRIIKECFCKDIKCLLEL